MVRSGLPYKIAVVSTHGVGKTTLVFDVAAELKRRGLKVKVFSEIAATACEQGIPINTTTTLPAQLYILMQHITEELRATIRNYQVVVCDRSVFDNWIYLERRCGRGSNAFILDFLHNYATQFPYDALYKLPLVGKLSEDGIRDAEDRAFQKDIYKRINVLLDTLQIPHRTLPKPVSEFRREWCELIVKDTLCRLSQRPTVVTMPH
ncbi:AAA family ATPase [Elusimicrobiota bacterium]